MHKDIPSSALSLYLADFRKALERASKFSKAKVVREYTEQLSLWEKEDRLVYTIRDCIHRKSAPRSWSSRTLDPA